MPQPLQLDSDVLGLGRSGLHALRHAIALQDPTESAARLMDAGYHAGEDIYACFLRWLPTVAGTSDPANLDAAALSGVLSEFFSSLGWGQVTLEQLGAAGLTFDSPDWAEAEPGINAEHPSCHLSAGILSNFLGKLASGDVAVMEVECRSANDARCRFLAGSTDTLQAVYDAMANGKDYRQALLE